MAETNIDELDKQSFGFRMRPVADNYYPRRHTDTKQSLEERWKTEYSPYVEKLSGQVVPRKGEAWRFQRFDIHKAFKAVTMDVIQDYVSRFVSTDMIGLYPLALAAYGYGTLALETMCYLFYRFYAPFMQVKVDDDGNLVSHEIVSTHIKRFLLRCEAEEKVTRRISTLFNQQNKLASMERSESSREYPEINAELGGIYQNLEPRCNRVLLREFQRFVVKITEDFPLIKQVVLADLGSGMNLVPLFASAMYGWKGLGIEVVQNRVMLAAHAQRKLFEHEWFQKLKVAMYCGNLAVSEFNWAGILCFLCWDKVFVDKVVEKIFKNIEASMTHDVVLIMSITTRSYAFRRQKMQEMFSVVEEGENMSVSISGGGGDTLRAFRLRKKPMPHVQNLVDDMEARFSTPNRSKSMRELEYAMMEGTKGTRGGTKRQRR